MFNALPSWDGLHPLIIHFPIALLLIAPVLVMLALIVRRHARPFAYAALLLMVIGTAFTYMAVSTGEAAGELAERLPGVEAALEQHEELAEQTQTIFTVLTILYAFIVLAPLVTKRALDAVPWSIVNVAFLLFYVGGTVILVNTGHQGGRLVHAYGVHAIMADSAAPGVALPAGDGDGDGDDD